ncbi:hypothetical protein FQA47_019104 [Oryzias melastigma]|uniref:Uncharacterized protein n=1 Tax=Oryzias melastigma TaxID=30732 RepID=A0A834CBY1_ORYME|nr:hypothetical protein FQA47_019104 [Oryzias melastigma]
MQRGKVKPTSASPLQPEILEDPAEAEKLHLQLDVILKTPTAGPGPAGSAGLPQTLRVLLHIHSPHQQFVAEPPPADRRDTTRSPADEDHHGAPEPVLTVQQLQIKKPSRPA